MRAEPPWPYFESKVFDFLYLNILTGEEFANTAPSTQSQNPGQVLKRAYPNEFKNFPDNDVGLQKIERIKKGFQEMHTYIELVTDPKTKSIYDYVFKKYFQPQHYDTVRKVLGNLIGPVAPDGPSKGDLYIGADSLSDIIIDDRDNAPFPCSNEARIAVAYQFNTWTNEIHFCETPNNAYAYPDFFGGVGCDTIGNTVSRKMLTFGGYVLLHELL